MHIVLIGNGIAGITAARFIRKLSDHHITVISAETDHFFSRTALMYVYMGHMRYRDIKPYEDWFWDKNRIQLRRGLVNKVNFENKTLQFREDDDLKYDKLLLATGSTWNKFGWKGQDLQGVCGLYSYQDLENMERFSAGLKRAVVVGGGLIGVEMAEMFHSRHIPVTFLVREQSYWSSVLPPEESAMVNRHIREQGIDLRLGTELDEIVDDGTGRACAVITKSGDRIECGYVGLTAGVSPNVHFLKGSGLNINKGIQVNDFLETNIPDVYAAGDCMELLNPGKGRKAIEAVWYTGRMAGETAAYNLCGRRVKYEPGVWFNSAKFFDIEYQVYGDVPTKLNENQHSIYWEHSDGKKSIRLVFDKNNRQILGFNLMGIRYRHEVCEKWIREKTPVEEVLQNLSLANFDPEFYKTYELELVKMYNQQTGKNVQLKQKRNLKSVLKFLHKV
jgi:NAD(P)H-nitrite reductase large subunit